MEKLKQHQLTKLIPSLKQPVLGICLGMQLMYTHSEEGDTECLGIFSGTIKHLPQKEAERVPHMGWNQLQWQSAHPLQSALSESAWMYFVHSYAAPVTDESIAVSQHSTTFTAIAAKNNFLAAQFHPERSARSGLALLNHFISL